jgi:hypothetical protein
MICSAQLSQAAAATVQSVWEPDIQSQAHMLYHDVHLSTFANLKLEHTV